MEMDDAGGIGAAGDLDVSAERQDTLDEGDAAGGGVSVGGGEDEGAGGEQYGFCHVRSVIFCGLTGAAFDGAASISTALRRKICGRNSNFVISTRNLRAII